MSQNTQNSQSSLKAFGPTGIASRLDPVKSLIKNEKEWTGSVNTDITRTFAEHGWVRPAQSLETLTPEQKLVKVGELLSELNKKTSVVGPYHRVPSSDMLRIQNELHKLVEMESAPMPFSIGGTPLLPNNVPYIGKDVPVDDGTKVASGWKPYCRKTSTS